MNGDDMRWCIYATWPVLVLAPVLFGLRCSKLASRQLDRVALLVERGERWMRQGREELGYLRRLHIASRLRVVAIMHRRAYALNGCAAIGSAGIGAALGLTHFQKGDVLIGVVCVGIWSVSGFTSWRTSTIQRMRSGWALGLASQMEGDS